MARTKKVEPTTILKSKAEKTTPRGLKGTGLAALQSAYKKVTKTVLKRHRLGREFVKKEPPPVTTKHAPAKTAKVKLVADQATKSVHRPRRSGQRARADIIWFQTHQRRSFILPYTCMTSAIRDAVVSGINNYTSACSNATVASERDMPYRVRTSHDFIRHLHMAAEAITGALVADATKRAETAGRKKLTAEDVQTACSGGLPFIPNARWSDGLLESCLPLQ